MSDAIYTKDAALLMLKVRNLIWEELGIRIRLSEEGAVERFMELGAESQNPVIRATVEELKALLGLDLVTQAEASAPIDTKEERRRLYRGAPQVADWRERNRAGAPPAAPAAQGKIITYRGQKMVV